MSQFIIFFYLFKRKCLHKCNKSYKNFSGKTRVLFEVLKNYRGKLFKLWRLSERVCNQNIYSARYDIRLKNKTKNPSMLNPNDQDIYVFFFGQLVQFILETVGLKVERDEFHFLKNIALF